MPDYEEALLPSPSDLTPGVDRMASIRQGASQALSNMLENSQKQRLVSAQEALRHGRTVARKPEQLTVPELDRIIHSPEASEEDMVEQIDANPQLATLHEKVLGIINQILEGKNPDLGAKEITLEAAHMAEMHSLVEGLKDKKGFLRELNLQIKRAIRNGQPLALAIMDGDHFKLVNDTLGHAVGDDVISSSGGAVVENLRETDGKASIGGDEFAVILPDTNRTQGLLALRKLSSAITAAVRTDVPQYKDAFTASMGLAFLNPGDTARSLIERADAALYKSKDVAHQGRITVAENLEGSFTTYRPEVIDELLMRERR